MRARTSLALGLALLGAAVLFGAAPLYPAAIGLLVLPAVAAAWVWASCRGLAIERRAPTGSPVEDRSCELELGVAGGILPLPQGELRDPLLPEPLPLGPRARGRRRRAEVRFPRRGRHSLGHAELTVADPFGLVERRLESADAGELVVLPRVEQLELAGRGAGGEALGRGGSGSGGAGPQAWAAEFEIDGLRPYRRGSPASRIHWPAYARTGELHERRITSGADAARLVVLDPQRPAGERELDAAVRAAASICHRLTERHGCVLLVGGEPRPLELEASHRNFSHAHHLLALVEAGAGLPALHRINRAGVVFWVSADPSRGAEQRLRRVPATRRILVRPGPAGGASAGFRVAGCEAVELEAPGRRARRGAVA